MEKGNTEMTATTAQTANPATALSATLSAVTADPARQDQAPQNGAQAVAGVPAMATPSRRKKSTREKDNTEYIGFLRRAIRAASRRVQAQGPDDLAALIALHDELGALIIDTAHNLHDVENYSWGVIGGELGMTRTAAFKRFARKAR